MQIDLSHNSVELLNSLTADGSDPAQIVEAAIAFFAQQRPQSSNLRCTDPNSGRDLSAEQLHAKLQEGLDDIEAGHAKEFRSPQELRAFLEEVKRQGRDRLSEGDS